MSSQPAKKRILKDLSQLRPVNERIEMLSVGIYQIVFRGIADEDFKPEKGTQVFRCWKMQKLDARQQIAWQEFLDDVRLAAGKSGNTTSSYGEYTDRSETNDFRIPVAYENSHKRRLNRLFDQLDRREYALLVDLTQDTLRGNSSLQIETIGLVRSGYSDKVSARAAGVVHIQNLLDRLADIYGV